MADVKTPTARIAFAPTLFKPQTRDNGKIQYGCSLLFPKGSDLKVLQQNVIDAVQAEWGDKALQMLKDGLIKSPFLDGDGAQGKNKQTGEPHAGFPGHTFIRVTSGADYKPKVFDRQRNPVLDVSGCPSGSWGFGVVNAFCWENKENGKGVTFGISLVQVTKIAEGADVLGGGGGVNPDDWLETVADEGPMTGNSGGGSASSYFD